MNPAEDAILDFGIEKRHPTGVFLCYLILFLDGFIFVVEAVVFTSAVTVGHKGDHFVLVKDVSADQIARFVIDIGKLAGLAEGINTHNQRRCGFHAHPS